MLQDLAVRAITGHLLVFLNCPVDQSNDAAVEVIAELRQVILVRIFSDAIFALPLHVEAPDVALRKYFRDFFIGERGEKFRRLAVLRTTRNVHEFGGKSQEGDINIADFAYIGQSMFRQIFGTEYTFLDFTFGN